MKIEITLINEGESADALQSIAERLSQVSEKISVTVIGPEPKRLLSERIRPDYSSETVKLTAVTVKVSA